MPAKSFAINAPARVLVIEDEYNIPGDLRRVLNQTAALVLAPLSILSKVHQALNVGVVDEAVSTSTLDSEGAAPIADRPVEQGKIVRRSERL